MGTFDKKNSNFPLVALRAFIVNSSVSAFIFLGFPVLQFGGRSAALQGRSGSQGASKEDHRN